MKIVKFSHISFLILFLTASCTEDFDLDHETNEITTIKQHFVENFRPALTLTEGNFELNWTNYSKIESDKVRFYEIQLTSHTGFLIESDIFHSEYYVSLIHNFKDGITNESFIVTVKPFKEYSSSWDTYHNLSNFHGIIEYSKVDGSYLGQETYIHGQLLAKESNIHSLRTNPLNYIHP